MQTYIDQLLEDIMAAHRPAQEELPKQQPLSIQEHFEEIEKWVTQSEPEHSFAYYCGLLPQQFPPAERLTDDQVTAVCKSFKHLLFSWNLHVDIPELMPARTAYPFIVGTLNEPVTIVTCGFIGIELCTYDPPSCPFNEYCTCIEFLEDQHQKNDISGEPGKHTGPF